MKHFSIKKVLGLGFMAMGAFAQASDVVTNDQIVGAFAADEGVQAKTRELKLQLREMLPNCTLSVMSDLRGHLFATSANTHMQGAYHRKIYLVSRLVACSLTDNGGAVNFRKAVTAKVVVNVRKLPDGRVEETPLKVVVVDINNADVFEIH